MKKYVWRYWRPHCICGKRHSLGVSFRNKKDANKYAAESLKFIFDMYINDNGRGIHKVIPNWEMP